MNKEEYAEEYVILGELPATHPLRNLPLSRIRAEYQWVRTEMPHNWHRVNKNFKIAFTTFNQLEAHWAGSYKWRAHVWVKSND